MVSDSKKKKAAAKKASIKQTKIAKDAYTVTTNEDTDTNGATPTQVGSTLVQHTGRRSAQAGASRIALPALPGLCNAGSVCYMRILGQCCWPASPHAGQVAIICCLSGCAANLPRCEHVVLSMMCGHSCGNVFDCL